MDCPITIPLAVLHAILAPETHLDATAPGFDADLDALLERIVYVESKGDTYAEKRDENAVGLYQIRPIFLKDVNRLVKETYHLPMGLQQADVPRTEYTLAERVDPVVSRRVALIYMAHYGVGWVQAGHENPLPGTVPAEVLARNHNGGPTGWQKAATEAYWVKARDANPEDVGRSANRARGKVWGAADNRTERDNTP